MSSGLNFQSFDYINSVLFALWSAYGMMVLLYTVYYQYPRVVFTPTVVFSVLKHPQIKCKK